MKPYVLVTYVSKYGSTQQIAERIGDVLMAERLFVDVEPIHQIDSLKLYTGVIVGSAIYVGQWMKEAVTFLSTHQEELAKLPTWIFSSGPTGAVDASEMSNGWQFPEQQRPLINSIHPRGIALFHGSLDLAKINLFERLVVKGVKASVGDFRDWQAITSWAAQIAADLKTLESQPDPATSSQ